MAEINSCRGCPYDCRYCYARTKALKNRVIASPDQWRDWAINPAEVERRYPRYPGQVMYPAAHDIFSGNLETSVLVIGRLLAAGNRVLVVSKPDVSCIARICREFHEQRDRLLFRFTITARDTGILSFWEPGAPLYDERYEALRLAFQQGFSTSVSIEPMLDYAGVEDLVTELEPLVSHSIWLGLMNRIDERVTIDSPEAAAEVARIEKEQSAAQIRQLYSRLGQNSLLRWKESVKLIVGLPLADRPGLDY